MPGVKIVEENNVDEAERKRKWIQSIQNQNTEEKT